MRKCKLKRQFPWKWKFCHLLTLKFFHTCMIFFLLQKTNNIFVHAQVWSNVRESKWQTFHLWVNNPFKNQNRRNWKMVLIFCNNRFKHRSVCVCVFMCGDPETAGGGNLWQGYFLWQDLWSHWSRTDPWCSSREWVLFPCVGLISGSLDFTSKYEHSWLHVCMYHFSTFRTCTQRGVKVCHWYALKCISMDTSAKKIFYMYIHIK